MEPIGTVLVPVDFSDCAPGVVQRAAWLARRLEASLVLFHAYEVPAGLASAARVEPVPGAPSLPVGGHLRAAAEGRLKGYLDIAAEEGVEAETRVVEGAPVEAILETVEEAGAGLVVMGTHGRRGLHRLLLGSVAEAVVRRADVPVLTVRSRWHEGCEARNCAVCTAHVTPEVVQARAERDG